MRVVIDRIEEEIVVVELDDGSMEEMSAGLIPDKAKEGDILIIKVDTESTIDRQDEITELMEDLWEDDEDNDEL